MTEPNSDNPQADNTPQENHAIETQAMNPVVTDQNGAVQGGDEEEESK